MPDRPPESLSLAARQAAWERLWQVLLRPRPDTADEKITSAGETTEVMFDEDSALNLAGPSGDHDVPA